MGLKKSKKKPQEKPPQDPEKVLPEILRGSPLGWMLEHWDDSSRRVGKSKEKMIQFCMEKWGGERRLRNMWFGRCSALSRYGDANPCTTM